MNHPKGISSDVNVYQWVEVNHHRYLKWITTGIWYLSFEIAMVRERGTHKVFWMWNTVKPGNEDHPGPKSVVFVDRWTSFPGHLTWDMKGFSGPSMVFEGQRICFQGSLFPGFTVLTYAKGWICFLGLLRIIIISLAKTISGIDGSQSESGTGMELVSVDQNRMSGGMKGVQKDKSGVSVKIFLF